MDTEQKVHLKTKKKRRVTIITILIIIMMPIGNYLYRIINSDLLTDWSTSSYFIFPGSSRYYLVNTKNGSFTHIPFFVLPILDYTHPRSNKEYSIPADWTFAERIHKLYPDDFPRKGLITVGGYYDDDIMIFAEIRPIGDNYNYDTYLYKFNISNNEYTLLTHINHYSRVIAGNNKIIICYSTGYDVQVIKRNLYRYYPESDELVLIGVYHTSPRNLELVAILK